MTKPKASPGKVVYGRRQNLQLLCGKEWDDFGRTRRCVLGKLHNGKCVDKYHVERPAVGTWILGHE